MEILCLGPVYGCTGKVSGKCKKGDLLHIPYEINLFHSHGSNAGGRTDDKNASARTGTISQKFPEQPVLHKECSIVGISGRLHHFRGHNIIHTHCPGNQRDIVDHIGQYPDYQVNNINIPNIFVKIFGKHIKVPC